MADGYLLSAASIRQLQADHRALVARLNRCERQIQASAYNPPDFGRETWWGITVQRDGEDYPDGTGDTYGVQLLSLYFDQTSTGSNACAADVADPGRIVVARTVTGCNLPEGSTVIVERRQTKNGVEHWIRPPYATIRRFVAVDEIAAGSSGTVTIKVQGLTDEEVEAYYDWADSGGATIAIGDEGFCYWEEEKNQWQILPTHKAGPTFRIRNEHSNLTAGRGLELGQLHSAGVVKADLRADGTRAYCILAEDINANAIGEAKVSGFATARVNVIKTAHTHCFLRTNAVVFETGFGGPLELCQTPTATGEQDLLVRWQPLYRRRILTAASIQPNDFGDCNFYGSTGLNTVIGNDDVYFNWMKGGLSVVDYGVEGWATWDDGICMWILDSAECD